MASYKGKALGTLGHLRRSSFHETKNYSMGEGGAIVINDLKYKEEAEIIRKRGPTEAVFSGEDRRTAPGRRFILSSVAI